jgi:RNA polymerase sigma-70 factor (ECF subfamily)
VQLAPTEERLLVEALRAGDETTFTTLVRELTPGMLRVARLYVPTAAVAEEIVQDSWLAVLRGLARFEGRSSLRTWIFRILTNTAKSRAIREGRTLSFSSLVAHEDEPAVDPARFFGEGTRFPGHWATPPQKWEGPARLLERETLELIAREIRKLPPAQAIVLTMRDVEGFDSSEVCNALQISEVNQRVLLHRARSKLRNALEEYRR